ncbi:MAG: hypothetical protein Q4A27_00605 [bacterium]|nr:hypothetical protein [bacterium]
MKRIFEVGVLILAMVIFILPNNASAVTFSKMASEKGLKYFDFAEEVRMTSAEWAEFSKEFLLNDNGGFSSSSYTNEEAREKFQLLQKYADYKHNLSSDFEINGLDMREIPHNDKEFTVNPPYFFVTNGGFKEGEHILSVSVQAHSQQYCGDEYTAEYPSDVVGAYLFPTNTPSEPYGINENLGPHSPGCGEATYSASFHIGVIIDKMPIAKPHQARINQPLN